MADVKISELTALTSPDGTEELVVNDGGTTKKITIDNLFNQEITVTGKITVDHAGTDTFATIEGPNARSLRFDLKDNGDTDVFEFRNSALDSLLTIARTGNVGIGSSSPAQKLEVIQGAGATTRAVIGGGAQAMLVINGDRDNSGDSGLEDASILFASDGTCDGSTSPNFGYRIGHANGGASNELIFTGIKSGVDYERMRIDSSGDLVLSGGVYLGGTGAANKLDDYEEGTWTPTVRGTTTNGTYSLVTSTALYTKVGRQVTVSVTITSISTTSAGTGHFMIEGLPFSANGAQIGNVQANEGLDFPTDTIPTWYITGASTHFRCNRINKGAMYQIAVPSANTGAIYLRLTMTYSSNT